MGSMRKDIKTSCQKRLSRIEGQVRGLSKMVEEERYCIDIVTQISAVRAALRRVEEEVLRDHVSHCVEHAIASGDKVRPAEEDRGIDGGHRPGGTMSGEASSILASSGLHRYARHSWYRKGIDGYMLVRLTRRKRLRAGWLIALAYLLCVLAPTISYALPGAHTPARCLTDENHVPGMVHVHSEPQHVHADGHAHDHAAAQGLAAGDDDSMSMTSDSTSVPEKAKHSSDGQCCGLMCVTALPATGRRHREAFRSDGALRSRRLSERCRQRSPAALSSPHFLI